MPFTRRSFLILAGAVTASIGPKTFGQAGATEVPYADKGTADKWMTTWMASPKAATTPLHLGRFADRVYFLTTQIEWAPNQGQESFKKVRVPVGFVTDFASIPRIFWSLLPPDGLYTYPAIVHDYLYWEQPVKRSEADDILRYAMQDFKVDSVTINTIFSGVRLGGEVAWRENAKLKASGEKRILKLFPTDPTVLWEEWKRKPGTV